MREIMRSKRGLAAASPETRRRVARKGGRSVPPRLRGLASASRATRQRVARLGGQSVPIDKRKAIGRKGGRARAQA